MVSTQDLYDRVVEMDHHLAQIEVDLGGLKSSVDDINSTLATGLSQLVELGTYTNQALYHESQQNDTIICILEHISKQTCELVTESVVQTRLQRAIEKNAATLTALYETTHAQAALELQREEHLRAELERCCPPTEPPPGCTYEGCKPPGRLPEPPNVEPPPIG